MTIPKPLKAAVWTAQFTAALFVLLIIIPGAVQLGAGYLLMQFNELPHRVQSHRQAQVRHLHELRAPLQSCTQYQNRPPLPAGFVAIIPTNERGDWLCKPEDYEKNQIAYDVPAAPVR